MSLGATVQSTPRGNNTMASDGSILGLNETQSCETTTLPPGTSLLQDLQPRSCKKAILEEQIQEGE